MKVRLLQKKWLKFFVTFVFGLVALAWMRTDPPQIIKTEAIAENVVSIFATSTNALVNRAVDGDTLEVVLDGTTEKVKVRLLGVDTPESVDPRKTVQCFGKEASKHTAELVNGKRVRLDIDPKADEVDKYGRLLRNVVLSDGTDLNAELVADGFAHAYLSFPLTKQRKLELTRLQAEAKAALRGFWSPDTCGLTS